MTRELNKPWRDDQRPSFRNASSNQHGDERPSHPARPRLSREVVDRAWQDGAQHQHFDYHPRTQNRPYAQNGRNGQRSEYSSTQGRPGNNNFNGNRRDNPQRFERTPANYQGPRSRPFEPGRRDSDERHSGTRQGYNERPNFNDREARNGNYAQGPQGYRGRQDYRERQPAPERFERDRDTRRSYPSRPGSRESGPSQFRGGSTGGQRPFSSRPNSREFTRDDAPRTPRRFSQDRYSQGRFEGDYEQFTGNDDAQPYSGRPGPQSPHDNGYRPYDRRENQARPAPSERQVTRTTDGRVHKGPRPEQRKKAQFWTEVSSDASELVEKVNIPESAQEAAPPITEETRSQPGSRKKQVSALDKPRRRASSTTTRKKDTSSTKSHVTGPRPSQRGFKWPTS